MWGLRLILGAQLECIFARRHHHDYDDDHNHRHVSDLYNI